MQRSFILEKLRKYYQQNLVRDFILEMRERELKITEHSNSTPEPEKTITKKIHALQCSFQHYLQ